MSADRGTRIFAAWVAASIFLASVSAAITCSTGNVLWMFISIAWVGLSVFVVALGVAAGKW